jgi:hypothetical protein
MMHVVSIEALIDLRAPQDILQYVIFCHGFDPGLRQKAST